jgi:hypothetical protein
LRSGPKRTTAAIDSGIAEAKAKPIDRAQFLRDEKRCRFVRAARQRQSEANGLALSPCATSSAWNRKD